MGRKFIPVEELQQREREDAERRARKWAILLNGEEVKHTESGLPMRFASRADAMVHARTITQRMHGPYDLIVVSVKKDQE